MRKGTLTPLNSYQKTFSIFCKLKIASRGNKDVLEKAIFYHEAFPIWKFHYMVKTLTNKQTKRINRWE